MLRAPAAAPSPPLRSPSTARAAAKGPLRPRTSIGENATSAQELSEPASGRPRQPRSAYKCATCGAPGHTSKGCLKTRQDFFHASYENLRGLLLQRVVGTIPGLSREQQEALSADSPLPAGGGSWKSIKDDATRFRATPFFAFYCLLRDKHQILQHRNMQVAETWAWAEAVASNVCKVDDQRALDRLLENLMAQELTSTGAVAVGSDVAADSNDEAGPPAAVPPPPKKPAAAERTPRRNFTYTSPAVQVSSALAGRTLAPPAAKPASTNVLLSPRSSASARPLTGRADGGGDGGRERWVPVVLHVPESKLKDLYCCVHKITSTEDVTPPVPAFVSPLAAASEADSSPSCSPAEPAPPPDDTPEAAGSATQGLVDATGVMELLGPDVRCT